MRGDVSREVDVVVFPHDEQLAAGETGQRVEPTRLGNRHTHVIPEPILIQHTGWKKADNPSRILPECGWMSPANRGN